MKTGRLAITLCATRNYQYALPAQAHAVAAAVSHLNGGDLILVTDADRGNADLGKRYAKALGKRWRAWHLRLPVSEARDMRQSRLLIARLRAAAFDHARGLKASHCWSLDSDVLPPPNALRCMQQMLSFDDGYYGIATCPYVSRSGEGFLFGRGSFYERIADDIGEDERVIPPALQRALARHRARRVSRAQLAAWSRRMAELEAAVRACPPAQPDVRLRAWRPRGSGTAAYPGIGKGSIVPTDWCGFGCTLLGPQALRHARFAAYSGNETEDLHVIYNEWLPHGLRICAIPHVVCDHIVRAGKGFVRIHAYHEPEGDERGHLRLIALPWSAETHVG